MKRTTTLIVALAALAALSISPAVAETRQCELEPIGPQLFASWGLAETLARAQHEDVLVRIDAAVPNGTRLVVAVMPYDSASDKDWIEVGKVEIELGTGLLRLCSLKVISPAFPVDRIAGIQIRYRGTPILEGWFTR